MSKCWGKQSQRIACLWAAGLLAGCAAPAPPFRPVTLRQSAPESSVAIRSPAAKPAPPRTAPKVAAAPERPGQIRLAAHDSESETPEQDPDVAESATQDTSAETGVSRAESGAKHPIDLGTVLQLTDGQNPQVAFARERIHEAFAQLDRAQVLWLPSLRAGITYDKHDGPAQQVDGNMIPVSRTALFTGFGGVLPGAATPAIPGLFANFQITDAVFQPRIARQTAASRQSAATAARNDALLDSALAYLELLRAEQDLAIAREAHGHTRQLADLTGAYAETGKGTEADHDRALAELAVRAVDVQRGEETVRVASARLAQQLSLDPQFVFEPNEPTIVPIELVAAGSTQAQLVARGLTNRPEVAESRHLIGEAVERLNREKFAPLLPSVLLGISYGGFGGGTGGNVSNFNNSFDSVAGAFWEVRNLGFGDRAARSEAQSRVQQAQSKEVAALDRVACEVVEAHAQVQSRKAQIATAQEGLRSAAASYERNLDRIKNVQGLPIEALQAIQALMQARREYLRALVGYNEAQFRLQRALGWPAEAL
ncbi:MAG: TolC family protein [Deltaproteobacteria bacterium]